MGKSGGWGDTDNNIYNNVCFSHNLTRQYYTMGNMTLNVCQFHPLGAYWRSLFCDAAAFVQIKLVEVDHFCNDECWYHGSSSSCTEVNATIFSDFVNTVGLPLVELER